jgi:hypothetical protein
MAEEFNPTQFAIEALINAGAHEQAAKLALKVSKQSGGNSIDAYVASVQGGAAPVAPAATLEQQWKAAESEGRMLKLSELRSLTLDQMGDLNQNHKPLLDASLKSLKVDE